MKIKPKYGYGEIENIDHISGILFIFAAVAAGG
jgi:hypothetical protein